MKHSKKNIRIDWKFWLSLTAFAALGLVLGFAVVGYRFSGLICFGIAALIVCYKLLRMLAKKHRKAAKVLRSILTACVALGLVIVIATGAVIAVASFGSPEADCSYVVVLGAAVHGQTPSLSLSWRLDAAYDYLTAHPGTVAVLSGGQGADEDISEAQCMYNVLTSRGIDPSRLYLEEKSTSTEENLAFSLELLEERTGSRPSEIGIVSSEYHLYRAGLFAGAVGVDSVGIPAKTQWLSLRLNYFLREIAGVWHYIVFGG